MPSTGQRFGKQYGVFLAAANLLIMAYVVYSLLANIASQRTLRKSAEVRFMSEAETQAGTIGYFLTERQRDVERLASSLEVQTYFQNRALGMSMQYGLRASLTQIGEVFGHSLAERAVTGAPLFTSLRLVAPDGTRLVENDALAEEGTAADMAGVGEKPMWLGVVDGKEGLIQVSVPVFFKAQRVGYVLAGVAPRSLLEWVDSEGLASDQAWIGLYSGDTRLSSPARMAGFRPPVLLAAAPAGAIGYGGDWLSYRCAVEGTPFSFQVAVRTMAVVGTLDPWRPVLGVGAALVAVLLILISVVRHAQTRRAEEALRASETQFQSLVANIPGVTYRRALDKDRTLLFMSAHVERLAGYPSTDFIRNRVRTYESVIHREDAERVERDIREALQQGRAWEMEYRIHYKAGEICWVYERGTGVADAEGKVAFLDGFILDITDRKRAEAELKERAEYHNALLAAIPDMLFVLDRTGTFLDSRADQSELLMPPEAFIGKRIGEVLPPPVADRLQAGLAELFAEHRPRRFDYRLPIGEKEKDFECLLVPLGRDKALAMARDVTDRLNVERELSRHAEIETLMATISMKFINHKLEETEELMGEALGDVGKLIGMDRVYVFTYAPDLASCSNVFEWCAEGIEPQIANLQHVPSDLLPWWTVQMRALRNIVVPDVSQLPPEAGAERELLQSQSIQSLLVVPLSWGGQVEGFIGFDAVRKKVDWTSDEVAPLELLAGIVHNAIKHKGAELQLRELNATLERRVAERTREVQAIQSQLYMNEKMASVGQLAAGVAHEINNPVSFVATNFATLEENMEHLVGLLQAYREGLARLGAHPDHAEVVQTLAGLEKRIAFEYVVKDLPELFAESKDGFRRISTIVNSMRSFARKDQAGEFAAFDLNAGLRDTLVIARNVYKYNAEVVLETGEVPAVPCVGGQINQVLLNLIVNAAQALNEKTWPAGGKGMIRIRTGVAGNSVFCEVEDNGPGIPEEIAPHIFDPFFTTKAPGEGTGLGLSISYDIVVNKHGGSLIYEPVPSGGACFRMALPMIPKAERMKEGDPHV